MENELKIGQIITLEEDLSTRSLLTDEFKNTWKKGTKIRVTAGRNLLYPNGSLEHLPEQVRISGCDVDGIADYLYRRMKRDLYLEDMMEDYDTTKEEIVKVISDALSELELDHDFIMEHFLERR